MTHSREDNQPFAGYLNNLWSIDNELTLIDSSTIGDDLFVHIVKTISKEFKEIIDSVWAQETSITVDELYDKLVDFEEYLKRDETLTKIVANLHHHHSLHNLPIDIIQIQITNLTKILSTNFL